MKGKRKKVETIPVWLNPPNSGPHIAWYESATRPDGSVYVIGRHSDVSVLTLEGVLVYMEMVETRCTGDPYFRWAHYPKHRWVSILKDWWYAPYSNTKHSNRPSDIKVTSAAAVRI